MTTKNEYLKDKQKLLVNDRSQAADNDNQYSNLNQNYKCPLLTPVQSCSKAKKKEKYSESTALDKCERKEKSESQNKFSKTSNFETLNDETEKICKKSDTSNMKNKSTLSLHIAAYENSTESGASDSIFLRNARENAKQIFCASIFVIKNPFEFPRQQQNNEMIESEMSHFKASQRLLNPNTALSNISPQEMTAQTSNESDIPAVISDDDDENIALPKKVRKKLLYDSDDEEVLDIEGGGKDIEEDLESKSEDESLSGEDDDNDEESIEGESGEEAEDDEDESDESDSSDASKSSLLSFDSEFSWDEFQYIDDNAENSFIQDEEESLRERYNTVMKLLLSEHAEEGFESLTVLYEEPLIQKQLISDFSSFDWEKAKLQFVKSCEPKMRMLTFGITRALAKFAKDPTLFYLQALSLRPTDKALWYEFGCAAARLHNLKTSEMAFKRCLSPHSDAGIKLAVVYFYSKDYHKCLPLLRESLTARPNNLALWVLKAEISKINKFWKFFVELYFPSNSLFFQEPTIPSDVYEKVAQEIQNFVTTESPAEKFQSDYSIHLLLCEPIRINVDQSMEKFAELLCKYFDQSAKQQLPFQQTVHFAKEKRQHSNRQNLSALSGGSTKERETPLPDSDSLSFLFSDEVEKTCSTVVDDMITILEDVGVVVEKLVKDVAQGKIPKPIKAKRRAPRKSANLSLDVRRSGRTLKEIPFEAMDSPVIGTFQPPTNAEPVTIRTLLDLPSNDTTFNSLDFPGAQGFPFDDLTYDIIPSFTLETFNVYLTTLLNKQHISMEELLRTFLYFFSWNLPSGCNLTVEQRKLYLEIYIRWTETFCQPFHQHCAKTSVKDASIHLLAFELDVEEKLQTSEACETIFLRYSGILQQQSETSLKFNEAKKSEEEISEKAMRSKAITLLESVDSEMAAKIKSCMEESRVSIKAITKETNIEDAIGALTFARDDYYSSGLKPTRPKAKKQNATINETQQEKPLIELLDNDESDATTLTSLNLCEPSTSTSESNSPNITENNVKFIKLWADLSKIMQRVIKSTPKEMSDSNEEEREMSPMDETEMISLLTDCRDISDNEEDGNSVMKSLKDIQDSALNNQNVEKLLLEYMEILEKFIQENKAKKEIEADSIQSFMNETKNAIAAMKSVINRDASKDNDDDIQMDEDENERLRELAIRFYWLKAMKLKKSCKNAELVKAYLSTILHLMDLDKPIYTQLLDDYGKYTVITGKEVVKMLMQEFRKEKLANISKMIAENKHQEVIAQFTTDFNWYSCDEKEIITNIQILLSSFEAVKDRKGPVEWICRLLDRVISGKFETCRDDIYLGSLQQLENLDLEEIDHDVLKLLAKRLVVFSEYDRFKKNVRLWKILYRVASILEGPYAEQKRFEMYQAIEACKFLMPTKALCLLVEGHRILGEEHQCCTKNDGELLFFFIDELYKNFYDFRFEDHYYSKLVQRNIELQLIQCLKCLFDSSIGKTVVYDHECSKNLIPTVAIAKKVQPFLIPNLPMFDDEKFTTNDVIEALTRVFPFIEHEKVSGFDQAWNDFEAFIKDPPFFKFEIKNNELQAIGDFENANMWPCVEITSENREKLELFVYLRYVLLVIKYKKQAYSWEENEKLAQLAKECLVLSGSASRNLLPLKVIHSLWAICAYTHTMYFCYLEDDELAKEANSYFYMFKMAFLQYPEAFQLHIDIAVAYYQINTRIRRHKKSLPDKSLPEEVEAKIAREEMIKQCQLHFNQFKYRISQTNEYPKDISWIEAYFSGKIAEHNKQPPSDIFEHYHRCAKLMRAEAYTYPLRVNKTTQENVEPLELHYRVHVYAMKQIFALENVKPFEKRIEKLKIIRYYLRLFLGHFIFAKKNPAPLPPIETKLPFVDSTPPWDFEDEPEIVDEGEEYYDDAIQDTLELMITYTDLRVECIEYCRRGFETIVKRFPHYKSYYQLALLHLINKEFQRGLEIIFGKLFKGKFISFEKVTDIERTDIERSDTLAYHIKKLIRLTLALLKKCRDIPKTNAVLEDLVKDSSSGRMKLKPEERTNFISTCLQLYNDAVGKVIKTKNTDQINTLIKLLEKASTILRNNKKTEFDDKIKAEITRCKNAIRSIFEAREKQRNSQLAASQLQAIMEVQKMMAAKQKEDLAEKMKQVTEEQTKKLREEEEERKRKAAAEKKRKEMAEEAQRQNVLAYQKLLEAKKVEEENKAKLANTFKLVMEKLNKIVNNPLLLPDVKKQMDERKPLLIEALKGSVEKGETLVTLLCQLDKFDNTLKKYPTPTPPPPTNVSTPATSSSSRPIQQAQRNSSNAIKKQQQQTHPINLSSIPSTSAPTSAATVPPSHISAVKERVVAAPPTTPVSRNIQRQQATTPQQRNNTSTLQTPPTTVPQKSPQPSSSAAATTPSKSSTTPSKTAAAAMIDNTKTREQVITDIGNLLQQFAPNEMKEFDKLKSTLLKSSTQELNQFYSTMFVRYICGKTAAAATNVPPPSTSSSSNIVTGANINTGKRSAPQISPSNTAAKVRRTENITTAAASISSPSNSSTNVQRTQKTPQINPQQRNTLQTPQITVPQTPPHRSSSATRVTQNSGQQQLSDKFEQVAKLIKQNEQAAKKVLPTPSNTSLSTSDDEIMIIGETKRSTTSASSSKPVKSSAGTSAATPPTISNAVAKDQRIANLVNSVIAQAHPSQQPRPSAPNLSRQNVPTPSKPRTQQPQQQQPTPSQSQSQNPQRSNIPSSSTSTNPFTNPALIAQFAMLQNPLVQQQMQHLLRNSTAQNQQQIIQAYLAKFSNQQPSSSSSQNQKRK